MKNPVSVIISILVLTLFASCKDSSTGSSSELPVESIPYFRISTGNNTIVDEPKVAANMSISIEDEVVFSHPIGIEYRGSTSQRLFPKKSYGIETWDETGDDENVEILGFPEEEDWILYGPYSDKTLLRNVIIMELAREMGHYASRTELAELQINDDYLGAYVFMEKIKRDGDRVDMSDLDPDENDPETITGGYILKIDKTTGDTNDPDWSGDEAYSEFLGFRSVYGVDGDSLEYDAYGTKQGEETYFLYEDPDADDITDQQKVYIQNYVYEFEKALLTDSFTGTDRTYTNYIDLDSFVDFFILNELSANPDAYRLSTFLHKDRGGKLKMGPIWDFNIAFGNDERSSLEEWIFEYNDRVASDLWLVPFWWERLYSDPIFQSALKNRWDELRSGVLSNSSLNDKIDNHVYRITETGVADRNFTRWPVLGESLPFNSYVGDSYESEIVYLRNWVTARLLWMDTQVDNL